MSVTNENKALVKAQPTTVATAASPPIPDIEVTAKNADEMAQCQSAVIQWCKARVAEVGAQADELKASYEYAVKQKWKNDVHKRHAQLAAKRHDFYKRMLIALEHGYQIVPSFPITAFAIRTDRKKPLKMWTTQHGESHTQHAQELPAGEGEYQNPFPHVWDRRIKAPTVTEDEIREYFAHAWKELEFPLTMAKPRIMEATTRAMALRVFDDLGILPGYAPNEGTRAPQSDPIIVARIRVPNWPAARERHVSFIIAWHLNTATL